MLALIGAGAGAGGYLLMVMVLIAANCFVYFTVS